MSKVIEKWQDITGKTVAKAELAESACNGKATIHYLWFTDGTSVRISYWDSDGGWCGSSIVESNAK